LQLVKDTIRPPLRTIPTRVSAIAQPAYFGCVSDHSSSTRHPTRLGRPEIIAHRGAPRELPENSLQGFARALELGADGIELDVQLTADRVPVVHHDAVLGRVAATPGQPPLLIRKMTAAALRGHVLAPGVAIPTLAEVLALVGDRAVVYVEIKAPHAERESIRCIVASRARCAVHSFDHRVSLRTTHIVSDISDIAPGVTANARAAVPTGILVSSYLIDPVAALRAAGARDYWQQSDLIDADLVSRVHDAGGRVIAWTVNDPAEARRLQDMRVDAICTDVCDIVRKELRAATS
jgi:glycerophosphoryl diester phosphodiesterase